MKIEIVGQIVSPREITLQNGNKRTYAYFISKDDGRLYNVESEKPLVADVAPVLYTADLVWGKGKNGDYARCRITGRK